MNLGLRGLSHPESTSAEPVPSACRPTTFIVRLDEIGREDIALAGGKGANLGELSRAGFAVPPGFVVTTAAYDEVVSRAGLADDGSGPLDAAAAERLRSAVKSATVPPSVVDEIAAAYSDFNGAPAAVRSSATAEDMPGSAFAGQHDTFLNVIGADAVMDAVRKCWSSLWTERAAEYRHQRGTDPQQATIAVVVQRLIDAEFAGVLLTANPITGARDEIVIDASPGLGEAVVSGLVTPDHIVVNATGRITERKLGGREVVVRPDAAGGVRHTQSTDAGALPDRVITELAGLGSRIAAHFGRPQDVEWAYSGGVIWIVQARPLTALPPAPIRVNPARRLAGAVLAELLPVRPYPLDMTTWATRGHGRVFVRMLDEIVGLQVSLAQMLPEVGGIVQQLVPPDPKPTWKTLSTPIRLRRQIRRFQVQDWQHDTRMVTFESSMTELSAVEVETLNWAALLKLPDRCFAALHRFVDLRIDYLPNAGAKLLYLRVLLSILGLGGEFGDLVTGGRTRTRDATDALVAIADLINRTPMWLDAFQNLSDAELAEATAQQQLFVDLRRRLHDYLEEFGHRETTSAFLMSEPTWNDHPSLLISVLKGLLLAAPAHSGSASVTAIAERRILRRRRVRLTRIGPRLMAAVRGAQAGIAFREDSHFHLTRPLPVVRSAMLEAGRRLNAADVLDTPRDVLHLRLSELQSIHDPEALSPDQLSRIRRLVADRAARRTELAGSPMISPATLYRPRRRSSRLSTAVLVTGSPASGGVIEGAVRVVHDPGGFGLLQPGEVLVCPYTNPSWTPLFRIAAAVVVDTGGIASHAAIVAREYGIPAIVGTASATRVLTDGQVVIVDGNAGQVRAPTSPR